MSRSVVLSTLLLFPLAVAGCGGSANSQGVAANVNGQDIAMSTYNTQVAYQREVTADQIGTDVCLHKSTRVLCANVRQSALNTLIEKDLVRQYAAKHHIQVTQAAFNRQWAGIYRKNFDGQQAVLKAYCKRFHVTPEFVKASSRDDMLQQLVTYDLTKHMPTRVPAVRLARIDVTTAKQLAAVRSMLAHGATFKQAAQTLNADKKSLCHREGGCGDVGWTPLTFVPTGDLGIFTAPAGRVVGPYSNQQVKELLLIEARTKHYQMTPEQELRRRQQLFSAWLATQQKKAQIKRNVKV